MFELSPPWHSIVRRIESSSHAELVDIWEMLPWSGDTDPRALSTPALVCQLMARIQRYAEYFGHYPKNIFDLIN